MSSSLYKGASFSRGYDWGWTAGLGDTTLTLVANGLPAADIAATKSAITAFADRLLTQTATQGYPAPFATSNAAYYWGSNGQVANNADVLALAHDFTGLAKYKTGVFQALDYLLGRNPLNQSYVAGYGEKPVRNVHHRFWANQNDSSLPIAPPGSFSGGPNAGLDDPVAQAQLAGCRSQKCFVDDIGAYSVNEVAINWNSGLAWLAAWAAEKSGAPTPPDTIPPSTPGTPGATGVTATAATLIWGASTDNVGVTGYDVVRVSGSTETAVASPTTTSTTLTGLTPATAYVFAVYAKDAAGNRSARSGTVPVTTSSTGTASCRVTYAVNDWGSGFTANITVTNTGTTTIDGWTLRFAYAGNQTITNGWSAAWTQSGQQVTGASLSYNGTLAPGASTTAGFNANYTGSNAAPSAYTLNGAACTIG